MNDDERHIHQMIVRRTAMGFHSPEEVKEISQECSHREGFDISEVWINDLVEKEYQSLTVQSEGWAHPTDTEKLAVAFDELWQEHKFISLHNAGFTTSDGEGEVMEIEMALREQGTQSEGYCFYQEQDLESALDPSSKELLLTYQKIGNEDAAVALDIGKVILAKLEQHGFDVNWDNDASHKIGIVNFRWRKVFKQDEIGSYSHRRILRMI